MAAEQRVFFRDVKPYEIPDDLSTLQGPTGGEVVLSHSVLWAPEAAGSISTAGTARLGLPCGVIRGDCRRPASCTQQGVAAPGLAGSHAAAARTRDVGGTVP